MGKREDTKARIGEAALALFSAKGVDQTTTRDIAAGAGIAEGTIYRHYASKDELVQDLFLSNYTGLARRLDELQAVEPDLPRKLHAMILCFCRLFDADTALFSFLLLQQHAQLPKIARRMENPVDVVRAVIAAAVKAAELPPQDVDLATALVFGVVTEPAVFKIYGRIDGAMTDLAGSLSNACLRLLGGDSPARAGRSKGKA